MIFCLGEGNFERKGKGYQKNLQIFNVSVSEEIFNKTRDLLIDKNFKLPITKWIDIKDIKDPTTLQSQSGGYLKTLRYEEAWKELWNELSDSNKSFFKELPNFDAKIFKEITGIDIDETFKSIDPTYINIVNISKGSNESINQFENTPIYNILLQRREITRCSDKSGFNCLMGYLESVDKAVSFNEKNLAEAMGKMFYYLISNKLI